MNKNRRLKALGVVLFLAAAAAGAAQLRPAGSGLRLGFRIDHFSQRVAWDDLTGESTADLKSTLAAGALQFSLGGGSSASLFAGYASSDLGGLMFRELPFSIDYEAGAGGGLALGGDVDIALSTGPRLRLSALGEVTAFLGSSRSWSIPGLAVPGSLNVKLTWWRARVGPRLAFGDGSRMTPYLFPFFHYIRASFDMSETIQTLSGRETKNLRGRSSVGAAGGLDIPLSPRVKVRAEAGVYPRSGGGVGYSATVATMFAF